MFYLILCILAFVIVWWFVKQDCDLEMLYALNFGKSIDKLEGKVIWITGASSGIGEHLAYVLALVKAKLILSGTNESRLKEVAQKCVSVGKYDSKNVLVLPFNIADEKCHQEMLDRALKHFNNKLDILVNNAGRSQRAKFLDIETEVDRQLFDINVFGLISLTRCVLRYFLEHNPEGQFAVTSSTAGLLGVPFSASYTGSKHALHGYFECIRTEYGRRGIGITMLCIGPTFSNLLDKAFTGQAGKTVGGKQLPNARKMTTDRCAFLMAVAIVNRIDQAWITIQPVLLFHYVSQYLPHIWRKIFFRFYNEKLSSQIRDGP